MLDGERPIHDMVIRPEYYDLVVKGEKIYEARTNDERRKAMKVGDFICLRREPTPEEREAGIIPTDSIMLEILDKIEFEDFTQLYDALPKKDTGFEGRETAEIVESEIRKFYTPEMEKERGAVAIKVRIYKGRVRKRKPTHK
jgi:ASC-1-like (ASCH) protein